MKRKQRPFGYFTTGKGKNRRVHPLTRSTGKRRNTRTAIKPNSPTLSLAEHNQKSEYDDEYEFSKSLWATAGQELSPAQERAAVIELTNFLSGYLSGRKDTKIETSNGGFYATPDGRIGLPDWNAYRLPVKGTDKWAVYRAGEFHETQHLKHSPKQLYITKMDKWFVNVVEDKRIEDMGVRHFRGAKPALIYSHAYCYALRPDVGELWRKSQHEQSALFRIRGQNEAVKEAFLQGTIGGRQKGKLPPSQQEKVDKAVKYARRQTKLLNDRIERNGWSITNASEEETIAEEVFRITSKSKAILPLLHEDEWSNPSSYTDTRTAEYSQQRQGKEQQTDRQQEEQVKKDMNEFFDDEQEKADKKEEKQKGKSKKDKKTQKDGEGEEQEEAKDKSKQKGKGKGGKDKESKDQDGEESADGEGDGEGEEQEEAKDKSKQKGKGKGQAVDEKQSDMGATSDEIEQAREGGGKEAQDEFSKISSGKGFELPDGVKGYFEPAIYPLPTTEYHDIKFKTEMQKQLKDWRTGARTEFEKYGTQFDVGAYISSDGKKSFRRITKTSVKGQKYIFVVDLSGSMTSRKEEYKKALINTVEVLDRIGAKLSVFAFGGCKGVNSNYIRVKTFEQGKWKQSDSGRMVGLNTAGTTPTHIAYAGIERYVKRHRPNYVITVTDGSPDKPERTKELIKKMNKHTKMVAFGLAPSYQEWFDYYSSNYRYRGMEKEYAKKSVDSGRENMEKNLKEYDYRKSFIVQEMKDLPKKIVELIAPNK